MANLSWIISGRCTGGYYSSNTSGVCYAFSIADGPFSGRVISNANQKSPVVPIVPQGSYANWTPGLGFDGANYFISLGSGGFWSDVGSGTNTGTTVGFFPGEKWGVIVQYERSPTSSTGQAVN